MDDYNRKSYVAYRMTLLPMSVNDLERYFCWPFYLSNCHTSWNIAWTH